MRVRREPSGRDHEAVPSSGDTGGSQDGSGCQRLSVEKARSQSSETTARGDSDPRAEGRLGISDVQRRCVRADSLLD